MKAATIHPAAVAPDARSPNHSEGNRAVSGGLPATLEWVGDDEGVLRLLDQTLLPHEVRFVDCREVATVWEAIRVLRVRGAPAIGVAAAYGVVLGMRPHRGLSPAEFSTKLSEVSDYLCAARPTAVNLDWAVRRIRAIVAADSQHSFTTARERWSAMLSEAHAMAAEDAAFCRRIGEHGAYLIPDGGGVLTHCNAGALATVAYGTALAAMYVAQERGRRFKVYADETRPLLQGARLTAYELNAAGIDVTVLCDNAAASLMRTGAVQLVIVGADRIAANGDTANKIGTFPLALAARYHHIPFYVAAPRSTFDLTLSNGASIPIEQRDAQEVRSLGGREITPAGIGCYNPAFDVTPAELIRGIITELGLIEPVTAEQIKAVCGSVT